MCAFCSSIKLIFDQKYSSPKFLNLIFYFKLKVNYWSVDLLTHLKFFLYLKVNYLRAKLSKCVELGLISASVSQEERTYEDNHCPNMLEIPGKTGRSTSVIFVKTGIAGQRSKYSLYIEFFFKIFPLH